MILPYPYNIENINKRAKSDPIGFACECEAIFNRKMAEVVTKSSGYPISVNQGLH